MKPGWKTSEFYLSLAAVLVGAVMASGVMDGLGQGHWAVRVVGLVATILGSLGYTASRGLVKNATTKGDAIIKAAAYTPRPK